MADKYEDVIQDLARALDVTPQSIQATIGNADVVEPKVEKVTKDEAAGYIMKGKLIAVCHHCGMLSDVTPGRAQLMAIENIDSPMGRGTLVFFEKGAKPNCVALTCAHCGNMLHNKGLLQATALPIVVRVALPRTTPYEVER